MTHELLEANNKVTGVEAYSAVEKRNNTVKYQ